MRRISEKDVKAKRVAREEGYISYQATLRQTQWVHK